MSVQMSTIAQQASSIAKATKRNKKAAVAEFLNSKNVEHEFFEEKRMIQQVYGNCIEYVLVAHLPKYRYLYVSIKNA